MDEIKYEWNDSRYRCNAQVNCSHFTSLPPLYVSSLPPFAARFEKKMDLHRTQSSAIMHLSITIKPKLKGSAVDNRSSPFAQRKFLFTECHTYWISVDSHHLMLSSLIYQSLFSGGHAIYLPASLTSEYSLWHAENAFYHYFFSYFFLHRVHTASRQAFGDHSYNL